VSFPETIQKLITSPPSQLVAGSVLAGIVWKFFDKVEGLLSDQTKLEIAVSLVGIDTAAKFHDWPIVFGKVFDRLFGLNPLSWKYVEGVPDLVEGWRRRWRPVR
jgi:hypothetical protein